MHAHVFLFVRKWHGAAFEYRWEMKPSMKVLSDTSVDLPMLLSCGCGGARWYIVDFSSAISRLEFELVARRVPPCIMLQLFKVLNEIRLF